MQAILVDMSSRVIVRQPHADELALLGPIEEEADARYRETRFPELADTVGLPAGVALTLVDQGRLAVADVNGTIAGWIAWCVEADPTVVGISQVSVLSRYGRAGIGTRLVEHVIEMARSEGFRAVALTTQRDVPWNAPWYQQMGFAPVEPAGWTDWMKACVADQQASGLGWDHRVWMLLALR
jgi:GNAT superfamily N-acetyltransferase